MSGTTGAPSVAELLAILNAQDNATPTINKVAAAQEKLAATTTATEDKIKASGKTWEAVNKQLDANASLVANMERIGRNYQARVEAINQAVASGNATQEEANSRLVAAGNIRDQDTVKARASAEALAQRLAGVTNGVKAMGETSDKTSYFMRGLAAQTVQFFEQIASGGKVSQAFIQQGGQVVDVAQNMGLGFGAVAKSIVGLINPTTLAIAAVAAVGGGLVALGVAANNSQQRLIDLQSALRGTRDDYMSLADAVDVTAKKLAATTSLTSATARAAGATIASSSGFSGSTTDLENLVKLSSDLARAMGTDVPAAAKELATALKDPAAEAQKLADGGFKTMNAALAYSIKLQADAGDKAGAFARVQEAISAAVGGQGEKFTTIGKALHDLSEAFTTAGQDGRSFADSIGGAIDTAVAKGLNAISGLINGLRGLRDFIGQTPNTALPGQTQLPGNVIETSRQLARNNTPAYNLVMAQAEAMGVRPELADFGAATVQLESGGRNLAANSVGATGLGQIKPGTAKQYGVGDLDLTDPLQNVKAMFTILVALDKQFGGDFSKISAGYTGGSGVVGRAELPAETTERLKRLGLAIPPESGGGLYGPPVATDAQRAAAVADRSVSDQAFGKYTSSGVLSVRQAANSADQQLLQAGIAQATKDGDTDKVTKLSEALRDAKGKASDLITEQDKLARASADAVAPLQAEQGATRDLAAIRQKYVEAARASGEDVNESKVAAEQKDRLTALGIAFNDNIQTMDRATASQLKVNATLEKGGLASELASNAEKALASARAAYLPGTKEFTDAVQRETDARNRDTLAKQDATAAQDVNAFNKQIDMSKLQLSLLTATADERNREVAILQERQKLGLVYGQQADEQQQRALDAAAAAVQLSTQLQQQQSSINAIGQSLSTAFDQVGSAITDAFVGGASAAVNWGNVAKSAVTAVLQQVLKLAVLNPIFNSLLGQNNPTLGAAIQGLSGGGAGVVSGVAGGGSSTSSLSSLLSLGQTASGVSGALGGPTIGSALGITGPNGVGSSLSGLGQYLGITGSAGVSSVGATSGLTVPGAAFDSFASTSGLGAANAGTGGGGLLNGATGFLNTSVIGTGTIGSLASGVGLGYGAGTFVNGLVRGNEQNGQIGSATGAVAGALIGSVVPVIGTIIGGLIGGVLGGTGGGLFGSKVHKAYGITVGVNDSGTLGITSARNNKDPDYAAALQAQQQEVDQTNQLLDQLGVKVAAANIVVGKGNSNPDGSMLSQAQDFSEEFSRIRFKSDDAALNSQLADKSFSNTNDLQAFVAGFQQLNQLLPTLVDPFKEATAGIGSYGEAVAAVNKTYDDAITLANKYNAATDGLEAGRAASLKKIEDNTNQTVRDATAGFADRYAAATGDPLTGQLRAFDVNADQQRTDLKNLFEGLFGPAADASADYVEKLGELNKALAAERKNVEDQAKDAARTQVAGVVDSLAQFTQSLRTSALSPLSAQDQYAATRASFLQTGGAAVAGDFKSLSQVQGSAQDFLSASRNLNGSGAQYAQDYSTVISLLNSIANADPDALTASAMAQIQQNATEKLSASLRDLGVQTALATYSVGGETADAFGRYADAVQIEAAAAAQRQADWNAQLANVNYAATSAGFQSIVDALSHYGASDLNTANMFAVAREQTNALVGWLASIRDTLVALRNDLAQAALAPSNTYYTTYEGNNSAGGSDRGS